MCNVACIRQTESCKTLIDVLNIIVPYFKKIYQYASYTLERNLIKKNTFIVPMKWDPIPIVPV